MSFNRTVFDLAELSMQVEAGSISQEEYNAAEALAETRENLAICSADAVAPEQANAIIDLVFLVKNRHKSRTDPIALVQPEDLDGFVNLVFENGWTTFTPFDPPAPMHSLTSPMHLAIEFGRLTTDMPLYDMNANAANVPLIVSNAQQFTDIHLDDRRAGDHIWIRARPSESGDPEVRVLDFSYFDRQCRWIRWNNNSCRMNQTWTHQRAMREALRLWDDDQFSRVTTYNLAWAVFFARLRFVHWSWGNPVDEHQLEDHGVFWDLMLMRDNNQGVNQAVATALAAHQRTSIPHFLPDRVFALNGECEEGEEDEDGDMDEDMDEME